MAYKKQDRVLNIPVALWAQALSQMRKRGAGWRESGAFLLGLENSKQVSDFICYDDLDANAYQGGGIAFHDAGYAALWRLCRERKLQVLADVHTHPGAIVLQSGIDQRNPMIPVVGHTALIVPHFGKTPWWTLKNTGVYEYLGNFQWRAHPVSHSGRVGLTLW